MTVSGWLVQRRRRAALAALAAEHPEQRPRFEAAAVAFASRYDALREQDLGRYVTPAWRGFNATLESALLPRPSFRFLEDPLLRRTMFVRAGGAWMAGQLARLTEAVGEPTLADWLPEDPTGAPELHDTKLRTSHNTIHHASHLIAFETATNTQVASIDRVVEWGGGYGNLAKLFVRRHAGHPTYTIIDTPLFTCLQAAYLSATLGPEQIHVLLEPAEVPRPGQINLLPLGRLDAWPQAVRADLFISTWALSESAPEAQDAVVDRAWFGASHLLLAHQASGTLFPSAARVGELAAQRGATRAPVPYLDGNTYAFR